MTRMGGSMSNGMSAADEKNQMTERVEGLGIPANEMTESVMLAVSALLEKLDDVSRELVRAKDNFAELEQLVDVDCVAPVPNRRAFMRRLSWAISMHERYGHPCSILYFDVNDFKRINDTHGHAAGDAVIRHVSQVLLDSLRDSDFMARLGGDEFAIIMYYAHLQDASERGRKIADLLAQSPVEYSEEQFHVTAACGAYEVARGDDPESVLANADGKMYLDKKLFKEHA
jgi:diguanylate cyclase (GGDEF)-like protein